MALLNPPSRSVVACLALGLLFADEGRTQQDRPRAGNLRTPDRLKVGDEAPDFSLKTLRGESTATLGEHRGKRPVALVFGSYT